MRSRFAVIVAVCVLGVACSSTTATLDDSTAGEQPDNSETAQTVATPPPTVPAIEPTAPPLATAVVEPTAPPEPTAVPEPTAAPELDSWAEGRNVGDCFNVADPAAEIPEAGDAVDCDAEHEHELFELSAAPDDAIRYPIADQTRTTLLETYCDPAALAFGGEPWHSVPFGIELWVPTAEQWASGDRQIGCTAFPPLIDDGLLKVGTAAAGDLDSADGIVGRSVVNGTRDFYFSYEGSDLYLLTNGELGLSNTSPHVEESGFLFGSARPDGAEGLSAYNFDFVSGEVVELETQLPASWQIASPTFLSQVPAFLFAARESQADDFELYVTTQGDAAVALTDNDVDDQWPTVTPDGSRIVFSSGGDIWIMNVDGTDPQQLTTNESNEFETTVSPDGNSIIFASDRSGNDDIWVMNLDGSDQRNLTNHPANESWPFFSADGQLIYFQTDRLGVQASIMMMELDGSNQSYFSYEFVTNAAVLPPGMTAQYRSEMASLAESDGVSAGSVITGAPGEFDDVVHSSKRLTVSAPAGWEYEEPVTGDIATLVVAPDIDDFAGAWDADGAMLRLVEVPTDEDWQTALNTTVASADDNCERVAESADPDGDRFVHIHRYVCSGSDAVVIGLYEPAQQLGLLIEAQWDGAPDKDSDEAIFQRIAQDVRWR